MSISTTLAVIMHADVIGSTALVREDTSLAHTRIQDAFRRLSAAVSMYGGNTRELRGDALVAEFSRASDAVCAALQFQGANLGHNRLLDGTVRPEVRVGIALGEVVLTDQTVTGTGVVMAQRVEQLAEAGGTCISAAIREALPERLPIDVESLGNHALKGFSEPVSVYSVSARDTALLPPPAHTGNDGAPTSEESSIAVLPFDNMSREPEQDYFSDGITEDIITELATIPGLFVISRNSSFTYKGIAIRAEDVCRDLGVRHLLEGSVRKAGSRVRVTAQLIDGSTGGHVWAKRFDRELEDVFAVQDEITGQIVSALQPRLLKAWPQPARPETDVSEAYDCFLRGREQYRLFTADGNAAARQLFERAIDLDAGYAAAYGGLALASMHDWFFGHLAELDEAHLLAGRAYDLDAGLPVALEAIGNVQLFRREHDEAIALARRWIEIEPSNADAYANLAGALMFSGYPEQVDALIDRAMRLNPYHPFYYVLYRGQALLIIGDYDASLAALERSLVHNPCALPVHLYKASCLGLLGELDAARQNLRTVKLMAPDISAAWVTKYFPYRRGSDLERLLDGLRCAGL